MSNIITIDLGGTNTTCAKISNTLDELQTINFKTQASRSREVILENILINVQPLIDKNTIALGIGSAGQISEEGVVLSATSTFKDWVGTNLKKYFEMNTTLPTYVINDVQAMLLGLDLPKDPKKITIALAIGTGVGGGIAIGDQLIRGHKGTTGELGHMILFPNGRPCPCGQKGCVEAYLSGTAIQKNYPKKNSSAKEILNDVSFKNEYIELLTTYLGSLTNIFSPFKIVIAGGVAQSIKAEEKIIQTRTRSKVLQSNNNVKISVENTNNKLMNKGLARHCLNNLNKKNKQE